MSKIYRYFRHMLNVAENIGDINEIHQGDWLGKAERIDINGITQDGREFTMTLEIEKEEKKDAEELE